MQTQTFHCYTNQLHAEPGQDVIHQDIYRKRELHFDRVPPYYMTKYKSYKNNATVLYVIKFLIKCVKYL